MRLVYFGGRGNFGDELNRVLWPRFAPDLFAPAGQTGFLGIGTIIGMPTPGCDFLHVFSSGVGYDSLRDWTMPHRIWCVRGPLTARALGADADTVLTDGAILAPWVFPDGAASTAHRAIGVMPHWESLCYPGWREACDLAGFTLIGPIGEPEAVVQAVRRTRLVITESLHGAIIADSYDIPWVPMRTSRNFSVFKWADWCLSMQVPVAAVMVPPPSPDSLVRFGRPPNDAWGDHVTFTAEDAIAEFDRRVGIVPAQPSAGGLRRRALPWLRPILARSRPARQLLGLAAGYRPARTAEHLVRAARTEPLLSRATLRGSLQSRMADRLRELHRIANAGPAA